MEKRRMLLYGFLLVNIFITRAQISDIKIASELDILCECDQVLVDDTMVYEYAIVNTGDEPMEITYPFWNGAGWSWFPKFDHNIKVKNDNFPSLPVSYSFVDDNEGTVSVDVINPQTRVQVSNVNPGDTAIVHVEDIVVASRHKEGNNTIVVWPENLNGLTNPDSLIYSIEVVSGIGLPESSNSVAPWLLNSKVYPNPAFDKIYIQGLSENSFDIQSISLINLQGQQVKVFNGVYEQYDISNISTGHYTINFKLTDGSSYAKPLVVRK